MLGAQLLWNPDRAVRTFVINNVQPIQKRQVMAHHGLDDIGLVLNLVEANDQLAQCFGMPAYIGNVLARPERQAFSRPP